MVRVFLVANFNGDNWEKQFDRWARDNSLLVDKAKVHEFSSETTAKNKKNKLITYLTENKVYYSCVYYGVEVDTTLTLVSKNGKLSSCQCIVQEDIFSIN